MAPGDTPAFSQPPGLPGGRSALLITTAAYADAQLAWLRPPVSGAADLAEALADPRAGGFAVDMLADGTEAEIRLAVARFLSGRSRDETVLVYLSCHAIRDRARLYFAATDTWLRYPQRSAVPAPAVLSELDLCGAGNRLLILDCCFSGGFPEEKGELDLAAELGLEGRGIAVLSGSRAREYSYEGRPIGPELPRSVFTEGLAVGLATGAADTDGNGISHRCGGLQLRVPLREPEHAAPGTAVLPRRRPGGDRPGTRAAADPAVRADAPAGGDAPAGPRARRGAPRHRPASRARGRRAPASRAGGPRGPRGSGRARCPAAAPASPPPAPQPPAAHATADTSAVILEQDRDNAYCVMFSPDGRLLASGGWGRPVRIRDAFTNGLVRELRSAGPSIYDLAFSPDGDPPARRAGGTARSGCAR